MDVMHPHRYYKRLDYVQQKLNVSFVNGLLWYSDIIENKNGQNNVQTLDVNQGKLKSKNWNIDQSYDFLITGVFFECP